MVWGLIEGFGRVEGCLEEWRVWKGLEREGGGERWRGKLGVGIVCWRSRVSLFMVRWWLEGLAAVCLRKNT